MDGDPREVLIQFDRGGALATTHESQGSDMGLFGGLLGWDADDERLPGARATIADAGVQVRVETVDLRDPHPSTYRLAMRSGRQRRSLKAISTGGGMIEVVEVDSVSLSIAGDYRETLLWTDGDGRALAAQLDELVDADQILLLESAAGRLVEVKGQEFVDESTIAILRQTTPIHRVDRLGPVLPVLSRRSLRAPFRTSEEMLRYDNGRRSPLWKLAVEYEMQRGDLSGDEVLARMLDIVRTIRRSIQQGVDGAPYEDRILGPQCGVFKTRMENRKLLAAGALNRIILYVTALMEAKSSMGVIVAAPTAGACAALPGACAAVADEMDLPDEAVAKAMLAAGLVGVFIANRSTFAAEVAGCQAEAGAASCMAAAALVTLAEGDPTQALAASSLALQNCLGMICDPVANRVESPCLGKNVAAAANALACANMALADYDPVIPLDEVIDAADRVGRSLPRELRCTGLGGLSTTRTSREIQKKLTRRRES